MAVVCIALAFVVVLVVWWFRVNRKKTVHCASTANRIYQACVCLFCEQRHGTRIYHNKLINVLHANDEYMNNKIYFKFIQMFTFQSTLNLFSAGTVFVRQNLTYLDVRFWRITTIVRFTLHLSTRIIVSRIYQSILYQMSWHFTHTICYSCRDYPDSFA